MMIKGSVPAHAYHGAPVSGRRLGPTADARPAPPGSPSASRADKCTGNDDTCNANRVRGQLFCAGHMKRLKSQGVAPATVEGA
jgi:hypothetical protein